MTRQQFLTKAIIRERDIRMIFTGIRLQEDMNMRYICLGYL